MNRIEAINSFIESTDKVVDVGCDQAKLSIMLANRNISSIACDISEKVIEKARQNITNPLIDLRVSNGLENIKEGEADTLVFAGMGTHTILEILNNTSLRFKKIITISNNYHDILRNKMNDLGYIVSEEEIVKENNKYYNLIVFKNGKTTYNESDLYLGLNHKNIPLYHEYLEYLLNKYNNINKTAKDMNSKVSLMINLINERLKLLK